MKNGKKQCGLVLDIVFVFGLSLRIFGLVEIDHFVFGW